MDATQRGMAAARAREIFDERAKKRQKEHGGTAPGKAKNTGGNVSTSVEAAKARDEAGKAFGVSGKQVDKASKVLSQGAVVS